MEEFKDGRVVQGWKVSLWIEGSFKYWNDLPSLTDPSILERSSILERHSRIEGSFKDGRVVSRMEGLFNDGRVVQGWKGSRIEGSFLSVFHP